MYEYVTPHILKDYGFVEAYPRRWIFQVDKNGKKRDAEEFLYVEIDEEEVDSGKKLVFDWHYDTPNEAQVEWIERQLKRLRGLDSVVKDGVESLSSSHEKFTITEYHRAYKEVMELALEHKDDEVSKKTVVFDEDDNNGGYDEL